MLRLIITILLVGAFFILFFKPKYNLKNKTSSNSEEASTIDGFVEDTQRGPILFGRDGIPPRYGDIGTFVAYSTTAEDHWLSGFPQKGVNNDMYEDTDTKLSTRIRDLSK
tara:strand:+ start:340 stop:669 length:330 start_codon:yes stop_codon:yes gene_type:complete